MVKNSKAISPVVATALLLVVAVVAVVGFQTWFNSYNSANMAKVEAQSNTGASMSIERIEAGTGMQSIYIKNSGTATITGVVMKVGGTDCGLNTTSVLSGLNEYQYNNTLCGTITTGTSAEIMLQTGSSLQTLTVIPK